VFKRLFIDTDCIGRNRYIKRLLWALVLTCSNMTNQIIQPVQLLTRHELCDRWRVSGETLKRRERAGILRPLKLGRGVRYRLADIERVEAQAEMSR
jgi:hypothetical protein